MRLNEIQIAHILDEARKFSEDGKYLHSCQMYERLIVLEPTLLLPYIELASLHAAGGNVGASIMVLERARKLFPYHPEILLKLGDYSIMLEDYAGALAYYRLVSCDTMALVHYKMGVAYFYEENFVNAEAEFRQALRIDPKYPHVNESIGELLLKRDMFEEAVTFLKKGISIDPYNGVSHFLLGLAYCRLNHWKKGYDEFVLSIDMDPNEFLHWQLCGEALMHLGRNDEAEQYLRKSLELEPDCIETQLLISRIFALRKEYGVSREWIAQALKLDPGNVNALELLASLEVGKKKASKLQ
jgi:tetratricopeptide (TPR) repeat protein